MTVISHPGMVVNVWVKLSLYLCVFIFDMWLGCILHWFPLEENLRKFSHVYNLWRDGNVNLTIVICTCCQRALTKQKSLRGERERMLVSGLPLHRASDMLCAKLM